MAVDVGSFGIPGNFAMPYYRSTTGDYDMPGLRKYLRGQLPPNRFSFTDEQLDKLISGEGLPGDVSMYDLQAGEPGGSFRPSAPGQPAGKAVVTSTTSDGTERRTTPDSPTLDPDVVTVTDPPPPPIDVDPASLVESTYVPESVPIEEEVIEKPRPSTEAYYDPNTGGIRGTFFGSYGTRIDPDTGAIVPGTEPFTAPMFDISAVYAPRTGPEGQDLGSYQDLFPAYLYGSAPSNALVELDRYGLGLDFVRANPALLQQWWTDVFKPVYSRFARTRGGFVETPEDEPGAWNPANIIRYMANPLGLLFGAGGTGPVGEAAVSAARNLMGGVDPMSMQLDLPLTPDSLLGQIFGGTGLTIAPGTSQAVLNALGNIDIPAEAFAPANVDATIEYLSNFFPEGSIPIGEDAFTPANIDATRESLVDALGDIVVGSERFTPEEGTVESLLTRLGVIEVGTGQFKPAPGALEALQAYFPNVEISPESFSPENIAATKTLLANELGRIFVSPEQFRLGTGYDALTGPFNVEDKLLRDLGIIDVGAGQFTVDDPASVVTKLSNLIPSINIGPEAFSPANIPGTVERLRNLIPDVTIDPSQFTAADVDATIDRLVNQLGTIEVSPDQFVLGTMEDTMPGAMGPLDVAGKLARDVGVVEISPGQFQIEDVNKATNKLITDLGYVEVGPGQFQLGTGDYGQTPEQKLLQDLGILKIGPEGFELDDAAEIKLSLLNALGMIQVGVAESGVPGFTLDPAAAGILRNELVDAINPLTAADFERDPSAIAAEIREDIVGRIDAINRGDIGLTDVDIDRLLDPLRGEIGGLPGEVQESAISPIQELFAGLEEEGRALPATFERDVETPIANMIEGLRTSLTQDIGGFQVPETFLEKGTKKAGELLDLLYGTGMGTGREATGIAGFQPVLDQMSGRLGSFDAPETLMGKVGLLQDALQGIDLDALTAPPGLDALVGDISKLGIDLPGAVEGLGTFQDALGAFTPEDQASMGMLLNLIGPEGIASLGTEQLTDLITRFREMQGTALTDAISDYWRAGPQSADGDDPTFFLDQLRKGILSTYGPLPEMEWEGLIPGIKEALWEDFYEHEPTFKRTVANIDEIKEILESIGDGDMAGTGTGTGTGAGTGASGSGWLKTLQDALTPKIAGAIDPATGTRAALPDLTAEYLTGEPVTASLLADLKAKQDTQDQELLEQLQRYGVITSGASAEAIPELDSLQRRERLGVLGSAAERIQAERDAAMQRGLDLSKTLTTRDLGMAELTGLAGDTQTLGGREADLDIISAVIAALDPELKIQGNKEELAELLLELLGNVPGGEDADWVSRFKTMVMGD